MKTYRLSRSRAICATVILLALVVPKAFSAAANAQAPSVTEASYLEENDAAMTKMMNDMAVEPSGDVDHDFVEMMVPHHQGAIDMAQAELKYGRNEQLRRIAQEIIVEQQQEIVAMRVALGQTLPPSVASPDQISRNPKASAQGASSTANTAKKMNHMSMPMPN